jgi:uncharacterized protein (DUF1778 family)
MRKSEAILIRLSKSDKVLLTLLAQECGVSVSEFIRQTALKPKN